MLKYDIVMCSYDKISVNVAESHIIIHNFS